MAICKECVHYGICEYCTIIDKEIICKDFVAKADYIKVVRCQDCKFYKPFNRAEDFDGQCGIHYIEIDKEFYCQYGEKKMD